MDKHFRATLEEPRLGHLKDVVHQLVGNAERRGPGRVSVRISFDAEAIRGSVTHDVPVGDVRAGGASFADGLLELAAPATSWQVSEDPPRVRFEMSLRLRPDLDEAARRGVVMRGHVRGPVRPRHYP